MKRCSFVVLAIASVLLLLASCGKPAVKPTTGEVTATPTTTVTATPFPTSTPLDPNNPVVQGYLTLKAKVVRFYPESDNGFIIGPGHCGLYASGKRLLFRGNISSGNSLQTYVAAAKKSGVLLRFGPPAPPIGSDDCTTTESPDWWGVYLESGKEQEFWDVYHSLE